MPYSINLVYSISHMKLREVGQVGGFEVGSIRLTLHWHDWSQSAMIPTPE